MKAIIIAVLAIALTATTAVALAGNLYKNRAGLLEKKIVQITNQSAFRAAWEECEKKVVAINKALAINTAAIVVAEKPVEATGEPIMDR